MPHPSPSAAIHLSGIRHGDDCVELNFCKGDNRKSGSAPEFHGLEFSFLLKLLTRDCAMKAFYKCNIHHEPSWLFIGSSSVEVFGMRIKLREVRVGG